MFSMSIFEFTMTIIRTYQEKEIMKLAVSTRMFVKTSDHLQMELKGL